MGALFPPTSKCLLTVAMIEKTGPKWLQLLFPLNNDYWQWNIVKLWGCTICFQRKGQGQHSEKEHVEIVLVFEIFFWDLNFYDIDCNFSPWPHSPGSIKISCTQEYFEGISQVYFVHWSIAHQVTIQILWDLMAKVVPIAPQISGWLLIRH